MTKRRKQQKTTIPGMTLHKATGQGRVRLCGKDFYLGAFGSPEATEQYNRLIGQWLMNGRSLPNQPKPRSRHTTTTEADDSEVELTVRELVRLHLAWAERRYTRSNQAAIIMYALRPMVQCYGSVAAADFGPNALRAVRALMIERGWTRSNLNRAISLVRGAFGWGVGREMLPASVHAALKLVEPIPFGADGVKESKPKELVEDSTIESIKPFISRQVFAVLRLMMLSGARCGEIVQLRPMDLNRVEVDGIEIIEYTPQHHKTAHKGFSRTIRFGPQASMVLAPFNNRDDNAYCFSPAEAERERRDKAHKARITPPSCGNCPGSNRKDNPRWKPGDRYDTAGVRKAITRAINAHNRAHPETPVPKFSPHQLRHTALTRIRDHFGIEGAMAAGGHHSVGMVELYSGRSTAAARKVAAAAG